MQLAISEQVQPEFGGRFVASRAVMRTPQELAGIVLQFAATEGWMDRVRLRKEDRWYERLYHGSDYDIWVISWLPGQSTGFHDHGESAGAFVVTTGALEERRPGEQARAIHPHEPRCFGSEYAHDVRNVSLGPAVSIHAYSPPLIEMNEYELDGSQLVPREVASQRAERPDQKQPVQGNGLVRRTADLAEAPLTIDQMLEAARARLRRLSPAQAYEAAVTTGAVLVDIRPEGQRAIEGNIPGALIVERNVLEWRFDPASSARLPIAAGHHLHAIVFCSEGYTSSLAAAALQDLGLWRATDLVGGFHAWRAADLPIVSASAAL